MATEMTGPLSQRDRLWHQAAALVVWTFWTGAIFGMGAAGLIFGSWGYWLLCTVTAIGMGFFWVRLLMKVADLWRAP